MERCLGCTEGDKGYDPACVVGMKAQVEEFLAEYVTGNGVKSFADVNGSKNCSVGRFLMVESIGDGLREVGEVSGGAST